jgi:hypothetical protein
MKIGKFDSNPIFELKIKSLSPRYYLGTLKPPYNTGKERSPLLGLPHLMVRMP